jgi:hypothetical protein
LTVSRVDSFSKVDVIDSRESIIARARRAAFSATVTDSVPDINSPAIAITFSIFLTPKRFENLRPSQIFKICDVSHIAQDGRPPYIREALPRSSSPGQGSHYTPTPATGNPHQDDQVLIGPLEIFSQDMVFVYTACMKVKVYPYGRMRNANIIYGAVISVDGKSVLHISNCTSVNDARNQGNVIADRLLSGQATVEDIRKERKAVTDAQLAERNARREKEKADKEADRLYLGRSVIEWAAHFGVTKVAIYKAARNKKISIEQEIRRRLPPSDWKLD